MPKRLSFSPLAQGGGQHQGDEVGLGAVIFANAPVAQGAGHVEVAQGHVFEAMGAVVPAEHALHDQLALAVGVGGFFGVLLVDGHIVRLAVGGGCGGKDKVGHAEFQHGVDQRQACHAVVAEIFFRHGHAFGHERESGKMDDGLDLLLAEHAFEERPVAHVAHIEPPALEGFAVAGGEIVHDDHVDAPRAQRGYTVAADITGAAGH